MKGNVIDYLLSKHSAKDIASVCNVTFKAVYKWRERGRLPRTEYTGETHYAQKIEAFDPEFTREKLLGLE